MNKYKLGNLAKKRLLKYFNNEEIRKKQFSFALINNLCKTYPLTEYLIEYYCCYGEDKCCWIDEELNWMRNIYKDKKSLNRQAYKDIKKILNSNHRWEPKVDIGKRKIFIGENKKIILLYIPLRDVRQKDILLSFDKSK